MKLSSPWTPHLAKAATGPSEKLQMALSEDIASGVLRSGDRLPPHREVSYVLKIGVGTVTKAYAALERRGLIRSIRGRGTFVSGPVEVRQDRIDLSVNAPPQGISDRLLSAALQDVAKRIDANTFAGYSSAAGSLPHRTLMARWLCEQRLKISADNILLCSGAQHALAVAFATLWRPNGILLTEAVTYSGGIALARHLGYKLMGVETDHEGLEPTALERALASMSMNSGEHVLYVTPTLQNPTGSTMGLGRRNEIVEICTRHNVTIVEDDVYSIFGGTEHIPLAALAPERTVYVSGLPKSVSPGLRIGALVVPTHLLERAHSKLQATCSMISPLSSMLMERWLSDGTASAVVRSIRQNTNIRHALFNKVFPGHKSLSNTVGYHVWIPMPLSDAIELYANAAENGVVLMQPLVSMVDPSQQTSGVRLSLGRVPLDNLKLGLSTVSELMDETRNLRRM